MHAINLDHVIPFYNPSNIPFSYNQSTRKSFSRSAPKMKLSLKSRSNNNNDTHTLGGKEVKSPTNLSFDMIDESFEDPPPVPLTSTPNTYDFEKYARKRESYLYSLPSDNYSKFEDTPIAGSDPEDLYMENYANDLDYYPMKSSPTLNNVVEPEREDFPVNNAQPPDYAPKMDSQSSSANHRSIKSKINSYSQQRKNSQSNLKSLAQSRKLSSSTIDLHTMDDASSTFSTAKKGLSSRNGSPTRNYTSYNHNNNNNNKLKRTEPAKEINHARNNRKITVQIMTKPPPPPRSKTSFDLRSSSAPSHSLPPSASSTIMGPPSASMSQTKSFNPAAVYSNGIGSSAMAEENAEISVLTAYHNRVNEELKNRYTSIRVVRSTAR